MSQSSFFTLDLSGNRSHGNDTLKDYIEVNKIVCLNVLYIWILFSLSGLLYPEDTIQLVNTNCFSFRVEGCIPACPLNMLLDEITQRCVYFEDCTSEKLYVSYIRLSLFISSLAIISNISAYICVTMALVV